MARIDTSLPLITTLSEAVELIETSGRLDFPLVGYIGTSMVPTRWTREGFFNIDAKPHPNDLSNVPPELLKATRYVAWLGDNQFQLDEQRPTVLATNVLALVKVEFVQDNFDD